MSRSSVTGYYRVLILSVLLIVVMLLMGKVTESTPSQFASVTPKLGESELKLTVGVGADNDFVTLQRMNGNVQLPTMDLPNDAPSCSSVLLYVTDLVSMSGLGFQLNNYILAVLLASSLNRTLVVLDPPIGDSLYESNSQYGCPPDDLNGTNLPTGLSRLVSHPDWLSRGCEVPCHNYSYWKAVASEKDDVRLTDHQNWEPLHCLTQDERNVSVLPLGGDSLRYFLWATGDNMSKTAYQWASQIGATPSEVEWFANNSQHVSIDVIHNQLSAILSRAGIIAFQPWIARDVRAWIKRVGLPKNYVAFHVRRGDKLFAESKGLVDAYWSERGYNESTQPTNYIPFSHYLKQVEMDHRLGTFTDMYIATDDLDTVRKEIANLTDFQNVRVYTNPDDSTAVHLQSDGNCKNRYNRTIAAISDLCILSRSNVFVGEYNSNWGRLVHTARSLFRGGVVGTAGTQDDTRIAFGGVERGTPGTR
jgi:hypothetical protein